MLSTQGGMDIEEVAASDPDAIARLHVDPLLVGDDPLDIGVARAIFPKTELAEDLTDVVL